MTTYIFTKLSQFWKIIHNIFIIMNFKKVSVQNITGYKSYLTKHSYHKNIKVYVQYRSFITSLLHACTRKETRHKYSKFTSRVCVDHVSRSVWTCTFTCKIPWNMHGTSQAWHFTCEEHGIMRTRVKCHGTCVACVSWVRHIAHKWNVEL